MKTTIFVISDLHIGGEAAQDKRPSFQMCPLATCERLALWIGSLLARTDDPIVHLVLAGDVVDFLAERDFAAFTQDPNVALEKLRRIFTRTKPVWESIARFAADPRARVSIMLGNHDIELSLPGVRTAFLEEIGAGRIELIDDNQALAIGPVLIEHGNRYDPWNAVPHDQLRRLRSQLSRKLPATKFDPMPGSQLVAEVMNPLKDKYSWVDLLKPETGAAIPILIAVGAVGWRSAWKTYTSKRRSDDVEYDERGEPLDPTYIASSESEDDELRRYAEDIDAGGESGQIAGFIDSLSEAARAAKLGLLQDTLMKRAALHRTTFDIGEEDESYLKAAKEIAARGFQVVVFGHTHLAKRIEFGGTKYLNTGTWADLMAVPDVVWLERSDEGRKKLAELLADLKANRIDRLRRTVPTFARIELDDAQVRSADVFFVGEKLEVEAISTEGLRTRMGLLA